MSADTSLSNESEPTGGIAGVEPLLLLSQRGEYTAIWQVERDPRMSIGNFSGAWLLSSEGVRGFASTAEWIPRDPAAVMDMILRYPTVLLSGEGTTVYDQGSTADTTDTTAQLPRVQQPLPDREYLLVENIMQVVRSAQKAAEEELKTVVKGSLAWENLRWEPLYIGAHTTDAHYAEAHDHSDMNSTLEPEAREVIEEVLAWARGLRVLIKDWNSNQKIRKDKLRRLYPDIEVQPLPLP